MSSIAISIQKLTVRFGKKVVLNQITSDFATASIHGIIGFNGSGKTTLFNTVLGHLKPTEGSIQIGQEESDAKKEIAYLPTQNFFYSYLNAQEYLNIFPQHLPESTFQTLTKAFNLPLDRQVEDYSSGMKKKLAFLATLKLNRNIYLLDEPFNGLDLESVFAVKKIIESLKSAGKTVLVTSHIPETLVGLCQTFHLLKAGELKSVEANEYSEAVQAEFDQLFGQDFYNSLQY